MLESCVLACMKCKAYSGAFNTSKVLIFWSTSVPSSFSPVPHGGCRSWRSLREERWGRGKDPATILPAESPPVPPDQSPDTGCLFQGYSFQNFLPNCPFFVLCSLCQRQCRDHEQFCPFTPFCVWDLHLGCETPSALCDEEVWWVRMAWFTCQGSWRVFTGTYSHCRFSDHSVGRMITSAILLSATYISPSQNVRPQISFNEVRKVCKIFA